MGKPRRKPRPSARPQPLTTDDFDPQTLERRRVVAELDLFRPDVRMEEAHRSLLVRGGFMEALLGDPRVIRQFTTWCERAFKPKGKVDVDDALEFVRDELGVSWPWCVEGIVTAWVRMARAGRIVSTEGATAVVEFPDADADLGEEAAVLAPPLVVWFTTHDGEATDEALERWKDVDAAVRGELTRAEAAHAGGPRGKQPDDHRARGRWFYQARVARPPRSINAIARENSVARATVRNGVNGAHRLLDLGKYSLDLAGKRRR
ncbi:MAG TPA: hypothetical protein VMR23_14655 [Candidatus Limnocylindria bacterium]|nr:hypothetical protein [Candidatus Limnocylindria bacterium]